MALQRIVLSDFVIVQRLELDLHAGFTVLTGETGAGKSILIDALALALGERGDAGVVRQGARQAEISADFDAPAPLAAWLAEHELASEEGGCILRRVIDASGRSRAFINGRSTIDPLVPVVSGGSSATFSCSAVTNTVTTPEYAVPGFCARK